LWTKLTFDLNRPRITENIIDNLHKFITSRHLRDAYDKYGTTRNAAEMFYDLNIWWKKERRDSFR